MANAITTPLDHLPVRMRPTIAIAVGIWDGLCVQAKCVRMLRLQCKLYSFYAGTDGIPISGIGEMEEGAGRMDELDVDDAQFCQKTLEPELARGEH